MATPNLLILPFTLGVCDVHLHSSGPSLRDRVGMATLPSSFKDRDGRAMGTPNLLYAFVCTEWVRWPPPFSLFFKAWVEWPPAFVLSRENVMATSMPPPFFFLSL